ncbi:acyltransferase family protein [Hymenobacter gummosus]|uniref:acyltransferase family protein n=1 Tax=Hymenobacter gummosus TaxID=1776032 RepID=UPI0014049BA9|nr:acyltransferase [Hymenobacter gummosus]
MSKKIEYNLEALRGFAALIVVWAHSIENHNLLDPGYTPRGIWSFVPPSHLAVLLFFVLSGYVIGLSTKQRLEGASIGVYLKKRLLRIYPIYFVSLLLTMAVAQPYPLTTVLGNFSLLQVLLTDIIRENDPSWSLHYELLYYLLFIPISYCRIPALPAALVCVLLGTLNLYLVPQHPLPTSYAYGFAFWLMGLALSQYAKQLPRKEAPFRVLLGLMLVLLTMNYFNVFDTAAHKLLRLVPGLTYAPGLDAYATQIRFSDFAFLPYAVVFVLVFANKDFPGRRAVLGVLLGAPALTFVYLGLHFREIDLAPYTLAVLCYLAGVLAVLLPAAGLEKVSQRLVGRLIWIGGISYGLYIVHVPLLYLFGHISPVSGSGPTFLLRFVLFLPLALAVAYWLERKFQPRVRAHFD